MAHNVYEKISYALPNQYKDTLCTTKVYFRTELHTHWMYVWCAMQVGDAPCRSMVHNVALYNWSGAQRRFHKPMSYLTQGKLFSSYIIEYQHKYSNHINEILINFYFCVTGMFTVLLLSIYADSSMALTVIKLSKHGESLSFTAPLRATNLQTCSL